MTNFINNLCVQGSEIFWRNIVQCNSSYVYLIHLSVFSRAQLSKRMNGALEKLSLYTVIFVFDYIVATHFTFKHCRKSFGHSL